MTSIIILHKREKNLDIFMPEMQFLSNSNVMLSIESNIHELILLNLFNLLGKGDKMLDKPPILSFHQLFSYFSTKTYIVGTQKNTLNELVLLSTQNLC